MRSNSGSLAMLAAMRRASSRVRNIFQLFKRKRMCARVYSFSTAQAGSRRAA